MNCMSGSKSHISFEPMSNSPSPDSITRARSCVAVGMNPLSRAPLISESLSAHICYEATTKGSSSTRERIIGIALIIIEEFRGGEMVVISNNSNTIGESSRIVK